VATVRIAVEPDTDGQTAEVAERAGASVVPLESAEALAWTVSDLRRFPHPLPAGIRWVQLPSAGVERWLQAGLIDRERVWTSAVGAYAAPVAEHALALLLAGIRGVATSARAQTWTKQDLMPRLTTLAGATVGIVGAGGIGRELIPMLTALRAEVVAVNRSGRPVLGAVQTRTLSGIGDFWSDVDHVVIAAPETAETRGLVGAAELARMRPTAWLVNVARGSLVDTDALVRALDAGSLAGAALDVTEPEPLPDGHPLWTHPRAIITPHIANPASTLREGFHERLAENIRRWTAGADLIGLIDIDRGY
jgi:phosphoglycerate dehydrogenase-like enzyme